MREEFGGGKFSSSVLKCRRGVEEMDGAVALKRQASQLGSSGSGFLLEQKACTASTKYRN